MFSLFSQNWGKIELKETFIGMKMFFIVVSAPILGDYIIYLSIFLSDEQ